MEAKTYSRHFALSAEYCQTKFMSTNPEPPASSAPAIMLHVFPTFGYGGQQARFATLAKALGDEFQHEVVSLDGDLSASELVSTSSKVQYQSLQLGKSPLSGAMNYWRFRKLYKQVRPDILCTYNWGSIEAVLSNRLSVQAPHVHFEDGFGPDETPGTQLFRRIAARRILLASAHVIVPSTVLKEKANKVWGVKPLRLHRIENGIDFSRFQRSQVALHAAVTIGSVGALRPEKNYVRLINAFAAADRDGRALLKIIGEGPDRQRLAHTMKKMEAGARISLPGATAAAEEAYTDFDIFALSSDTEQAPLTVMEAMATGLPVVAPNVGDIADMVSSENRAFITPCGDDSAYIEALSHLLQNPDARAALGAANRKKAKAEFDLAPMVEKYRAIFKALL
jgi:glycosyltransferase involved in cell wall biosynthesis